MKKAILVIAVLVIALIGLTSYNSSPDTTRKSNDHLLAQIKTGGEGSVVIKGGGSKKQD